MMLKKSTLLLIGAVAAALSMSALTASAQGLVLTDNRGDTNAIWFITGEASLVMNGFDLRTVNMTLPAAIDKVSISVAAPTPGNPVEIVIYEDANGGSPSDATLVGRAQADITQTGVFTFTFNTPVVIRQPAVWVGFYLPVDFKFYADRSGTSVLTYWAWTPGARFDLASLSGASVLGPGDGTAPVSLNMNGIARITAEAHSITDAEAAQAPQIVQVSGSSAANTSPLVEYPDCDFLFLDTEDVGITLHGAVAFYCKWTPPAYSPPTPEGYERRGDLYDVYVFGATLSSSRLPAEVTHCIRPPAEDIDRAVVGVAKDLPRRWFILPSQRYGDLVCAEIAEVGLISYFVTVAPPTPVP